MTEGQATKILSELEILRKLKIFELLSAGHSQSQIAAAIGVSQPTISRMMPASIAKRRVIDND